MLLLPDEQNESSVSSANRFARDHMGPGLSVVSWEIEDPKEGQIDYCLVLQALFALGLLFFAAWLTGG